MNIGIYIINSKDINAECRVGNTKKVNFTDKKTKHHYLQVFIIILKGQLRERERERKRERQREVKGEYKDSGWSERETRRHKKQSSGANQRGQRIKQVTEF